MRIGAQCINASERSRQTRCAARTDETAAEGHSPDAPPFLYLKVWSVYSVADHRTPKPSNTSADRATNQGAARGTSGSPGKRIAGAQTDQRAQRNNHPKMLDHSTSLAVASLATVMVAG